MSNGSREGIILKRLGSRSRNASVKPRVCSLKKGGLNVQDLLDPYDPSVFHRESRSVHEDSIFL